MNGTAEPIDADAPDFGRWSDDGGAQVDDALVHSVESTSVAAEPSPENRVATLVELLERVDRVLYAPEEVGVWDQLALRVDIAKVLADLLSTATGEEVDERVCYDCDWRRFSPLPKDSDKQD